MQVNLPYLETFYFISLISDICTDKKNMTTLVRDIDIIRDQFPILHQQVNGKPLVYFDNAATAQKPRKVIDAISDYYSTINSNVHRGVHTLSQRATDSFEGARTRIAKHLNAGDPHQIIFTRGTTEGINLIAYSFGQTLKSGDEIILSALEHHSNIVPWQMLAERKGLTIKVIPMNDAGELDMEVYASLLSKRTALVSVNHISNALGTINPVEEITRLAHEVGAVVHIDGAQSVPHMKVDLQKLDVDLYTFSAHKAYGPTGFGVLFGKRSLLEAIPPFHGGGEMIETVTFEKTTYAGLPHKFEAGTPDIAGAIGLAAALDWMEEVGLDNIALQENDLLSYATEHLMDLGGITLYGTASKKAGVISFNVDGVHPYDTGVILDKLGIAVRTGHHCTQPIMDRFGIPGTVRASFAIYNTREEVDRLIEGLKKVKQMFL